VDKCYGGPFDPQTAVWATDHVAFVTQSLFFSLFKLHMHVTAPNNNTFDTSE